MQSFFTEIDSLLSLHNIIISVIYILYNILFHVILPVFCSIFQIWWVGLWWTHDTFCYGTLLYVYLLWLLNKYCTFPSASCCYSKREQNRTCVQDIQKVSWFFFFFAKVSAYYSLYTGRCSFSFCSVSWVSENKKQNKKYSGYFVLLKERKRIVLEYHGGFESIIILYQ